MNNELEGSAERSVGGEMVVSDDVLKSNVLYQTGESHEEFERTTDVVSCTGIEPAPDESIDVPVAFVIDPPRGWSERLRDDLLRILDGRLFQVLGIFVLVGVIADGALFFFFLMGWQTLCRPRTDCNPRNDIYNISVQILNGLFTYMATVSMPWRCTNWMHTVGWSCPHRRKNDPGFDLYGLPTRSLWFHLPLRQRGLILFVLIWNCLFQYINQAMRIVYWSYDLQATHPGNIHTNVFFAASFLAAGIGGGLLLYFAGQLRRQHPGKFDPGPLATARSLWRQYFSKVRGKEETTKEDDDDEKENAADESSQPPLVFCESDERQHPDPTRDLRRANVLRSSRDELRLWAM